MIKVFVLSPQSTTASEKVNKPGDNALFVVLKMLRELGFLIVGNEVSELPKGLPLNLRRRARAIELHKTADVTVIMGSDTLRSVKSWFPTGEAINAPQPFFYMNEPGRVKLELVRKIENAYTPTQRIYGLNISTKEFGV